MKFLSIIGTRPNIIKLAPIHYELTERGHTHIILHTGQHYDDNMSKSLMDELELPEVDYELGIRSSWLTTMLSSMLQPIGDILNLELPDMVIVYGDVVSSLAGALAGVQNKHQVAHVEAGVRNNDMRITEHFNRIIIDRIAQINFCCTKTDMENLAREGIGKRGYLVGDPMKDLFLRCAPTDAKPGDHALLTLHRPENVDDRDRLSYIMESLNRSKKQILWPIHPRTVKMLARFSLTPGSNIKIVEPMTYKQMCKAIHESDMVITDSGGVQKEAYWAKKPCIVVFDDIAWPEIFCTGNQAVIRGKDLSKLPDTLPGLIDGFRGSVNRPRIYGDGDASRKAVEIMETLAGTDLFLEG